MVKEERCICQGRVKHEVLSCQEEQICYDRPDEAPTAFGPSKHCRTAHQDAGICLHQLFQISRWGVAAEGLGWAVWDFPLQLLLPHHHQTQNARPVQMKLNINVSRDVGGKWIAE